MKGKSNVDSFYSTTSHKKPTNQTNKHLRPSNQGKCIAPQIIAPERHYLKPSHISCHSLHLVKEKWLWEPTQ